MDKRKRAYYQKKDGKYFLASADDYTRYAYESMGYRYTTKTDVPAIVMAPALPKEDQEMVEYLKYFPLVVVDDRPSSVEVSTMPSIATKVIKLIEDKRSWTGTASELFQHGVLDFLNRSGIQVVRNRTMAKRLIQITKGGMA